MARGTQYTIYFDTVNEVSIDEFFGCLTPFNLRKDIKGQKTLNLKSFLINVTSLLQMCPHGKNYVVLHVVSFHKLPIAIAKLKIGDPASSKGSSGGFRCIVLTDDDLSICILLHLYSKDEKETLSDTEDNQLIKLLATYQESKT